MSKTHAVRSSHSRLPVTRLRHRLKSNWSYVRHQWQLLPAIVLVNCLDKLLLPLGLCGSVESFKDSLSCSSSAASLGPAARQLLLGVVPHGKWARLSALIDWSSKARGAFFLLFGFFCVCASTRPDCCLRAPPASKLSTRSSAALSPPLELSSPNVTARASSKHAKHGPPHVLEVRSSILRRWFEHPTGRSIRPSSVLSCFELLNSCFDPICESPLAIRDFHLLDFVFCSLHAEESASPHHELLRGAKLLGVKCYCWQLETP